MTKTHFDVLPVATESRGRSSRNADTAGSSSGVRIGTNRVTADGGGAQRGAECSESEAAFDDDEDTSLADGEVF